MDREPSASGLTNSVQEGDGTILLVVLYSKPNGRVNTVYVLEEALFVGLLVDDKCVIHIPAQSLGGWGAVLRAFCSKYSMYKLATMGLTGNPWQHPPPVHRTGLGKKSMCFERKFQEKDNVPTSITVLSLRVLSLSNRSIDEFRAGSMGTEVNKARNIKESIYIRVNKPLNNNIGKFNLSHIWDKVLLNT